MREGLDLQPTLPYDVTTEYNITEMMEHFDSNYIFDIINNKIDSIKFDSVLPVPNIVSSFEENFKAMYDRFPGDNDNIRMIRNQVYSDIIIVLCNRFNLEFNDADDSIDRYTAAHYLYDFLVCNRSTYLVNFFTAFIINNKDSICDSLDLEGYRKNKDSASAYNKRVHTDPKYGLICSNIPLVLQNISSLPVTLYDIFRSVYVNPQIVAMFDNMVIDKGNFFNDFYCSILNMPEYLPIVVVNIILSLQKLVGSPAQQSISEMLLINDQNGGVIDE